MLPDAANMLAASGTLLLLEKLTHYISMVGSATFPRYKGMRPRSAVYIGRSWELVLAV